MNKETKEAGNEIIFLINNGKLENVGGKLETSREIIGKVHLGEKQEDYALYK